MIINKINQPTCTFLIHRRNKPHERGNLPVMNTAFLEWTPMLSKLNNQTRIAAGGGPDGGGLTGSIKMTRVVKGL